jgi:hypothetical protein
MTNKEIKKVKGIFKKLEIPIYVENFYEKPPSLFEMWNIKINFKDNLDLHIIFDFSDKGKCEFDLIFKGDLVNTNNKIGYGKNYFRLFNKVCKNSYKFEIIRNKKLDYNLCKIYDILDINYDTINKMTLLVEILINNYIIKKHINYMYNYDIIKYNQKIIDKRVQKYEKKIEAGLYINNIYYSIMKDKIIDDTEKLYLLEKYYNKYVIKNIKY